MKTIWKNLASRVWFIVTAIVLVLVVVVNVLATSVFYDLISTVLGRETMKLSGEEKGLFVGEKEFTTKEEALANGYSVAKQVCEEGFTLLKNDDAALPLAEGAKISVFGKNSVNMAIGGSGSGGSLGKKSVTIFDSLTTSGFKYNQKLVDFYNDNTKSGKGRSGNPTDLDNGNAVTLDEGETPQASYTSDLWESCNEFKDAALIVFTRIGGEGFDMPRNSDGTHSLQLSQNEKDLIEAVKAQSFGKVIIVLNTAATMELKDVNDDDGIDAILWVGFAGVEA